MCLGEVKSNTVTKSVDVSPPPNLVHVRQPHKDWRADHQTKKKVYQINLIVLFWGGLKTNQLVTS